MFTDGKKLMPNYKLQTENRTKKITSATDFMAFLVKALFRWNECSKNADISVLSNFPPFFFKYFAQYREILPSAIYMPNFRSIGPFKQKLQRGQNLPPPPPYQSAKSPVFRVKLRDLAIQDPYFDHHNSWLIHCAPALPKQMQRQHGKQN